MSIEKGIYVGPPETSDVGDKGHNNKSDKAFQTLRRDNARLLSELEVAYRQMAEMMEAAECERRVTYEELQLRNEELHRRLSELEQTHVRLQETQRLLLRTERLSAMGQLAVAIVHEIKTPLTVIIGKVELMLMEEQEAAKRAELNTVLEAGWHLNELVQNSLRFARRRKVKSRLVDLNELVGQVQKFFGPLVRRIQLDVALAGGLPLLAADPSQVEQVLTNFLMNALDSLERQTEAQICIATGVDSPAALMAREEAAGWQTYLALDAEPEVLQEARVYVEVRDNGPGIPEKQLEEIFETFFTTKGKDKGTGLGLAISRSIVADHQGNILVASREGSGASFRLLLPAAEKAMWKRAG